MCVQASILTKLAIHNQSSNCVDIFTIDRTESPHKYGYLEKCEEIVRLRRWPHTRLSKSSLYTETRPNPRIGFHPMHFKI